ncbi:MAG: peptidoglycan DD-metalloendopeptidase family protein [Rickettsiales bacterium]|nr:peptidoglycan DD-metalloendopeptidase family protein [Rickettsiales bacterium]
MKKVFGFLGLAVVLILSACDLQPGIVSLPDSVGDFISTRYPALLADPATQPEIYNSAAADYGVYASPDMYGASAMDDYILYASVDDYALPPTTAPAQSPVYGGTPVANITSATPDDYLMIPVYDAAAHAQLQQVEITVQQGDTLYSLSKRYSLSVDDLAGMNKLSAPYSLAVGQKLKVAKPKELVTAETKAEIKGEPVKAQLIDVTVGGGDTLYSISRKFSVPVNELAVLNKLSAPFVLSIGQNLKIPVVVVDKPAATPVRAAVPVQSVTPVIASPAAPSTPVAPTSVVVPKQKISSDPAKTLPAIAKRSSAKFSWPVRGAILSSYGAKNNGLFNDGVNISVKAGTKVGAAENGVVAYAGNEVKGMGNLVIVQHSDGWMTVYAHMDKMSVRRGVKVTVGQQIGTVGQTGKVDSPQLHFEIRKGTKAYDPSSYLKK